MKTKEDMAKAARKRSLKDIMEISKGLIEKEQAKGGKSVQVCKYEPREGNKTIYIIVSDEYTTEQTVARCKANYERRQTNKKA